MPREIGDGGEVVDHIAQGRQLHEQDLLRGHGAF
jgi:hypothetical protein